MTSPLAGKVAMLSPSDNSGCAQITDDAPLQNGHRSARLSTIQEMAAVIDAVVASMTELGYPAKDIFGVRLALEEAVANALKHGHQFDPTKTVKIRYSVNQDYVLAEVIDEGPGFDPECVPDPTAPENLERCSGRGLLLMNT